MSPTEAAKAEIEKRLSELEAAKVEADAQVDESLRQWTAAQERLQMLRKLSVSSNARSKELRQSARDAEARAVAAIIEGADFGAFADVDAISVEISRIDRFVGRLLPEILNTASRAVVEAEAEHEDRLADQCAALADLKHYRLSMAAAPLVQSEGAIQLSGGTTEALRAIAARHRLTASTLRAQ
jgi:hypothetical protein